MNSNLFFIEEIKNAPLNVFGFDSSQRSTGCNLAQLKTFDALKSTNYNLAQRNDQDKFLNSIIGKPFDYLSETFHLHRNISERIISASSVALRENKTQISIQSVFDKPKKIEFFTCYIPFNNTEILGFAIDLTVVRNFQQLLSDVNSIPAKTIPEFFEYIINFSNHNIVREKGRSLTCAKISKRELDCVKLLARGMSNYYIAIALNLSRRTVESYIINARDKLYCKNSVELVFKCAKLGLI